MLSVEETNFCVSLLVCILLILIVDRFLIMDNMSRQLKLNTDALERLLVRKDDIDEYTDSSEDEEEYTDSSEDEREYKRKYTDTSSSDDESVPSPKRRKID